MERLIFISVAILFLIVMSFSVFAQQCPIGSYPSVDNWGNRICKSFDTGRATTIEGGLDKCPTGTHIWVDEWGNRICKSFEGNQQYYDTLKGCPVGMYPWVDTWGNRVCKKF